MDDSPATVNATMPSASGEGDYIQHSRQPYQIAITSVFLSLSLFAVAVRLWVRKHMTNSVGGDDYMMVIAVLGYTMYNAALMVIVANGGGTHIRGLEATRTAQDWLIINESFYLLTQIFLKLSLGLFFLRVVIRNGQRRFIYATITFCSIINLYHIFFVIFRCGDPRKVAENQQNGKCVSNNVVLALAYEQSAVSTITDMIFAVLPIPLLWNATMDRRSKISAGLILSLGAFGSICSIVRFLYVKNLAFDEDFFYSAVNISTWSTIELATGIIAGSLATMRPLLKRMVKIGREHMTLHARATGGNSGKTGGAKPLTSKSSLTKQSKPSPIVDLESLPSVFRPWESVGESQGYTTTVIGGHEIEKEIKKSMNNSMTRSVDIMSSIDHVNRAAIWPFVEDAVGIAKVVDVTVSVSQANTPTSTEPSPSSASPTAAKSWTRRFEDLVKKPERSHTNTSNTITSIGSIHNIQFSNHNTNNNTNNNTNDNTKNNTRNNTYIDNTRSSTPEWERLPDLVVLAELSRRSTEDADEKSEDDSSKSPKSSGSSGPQRSPSS